VKLYGSVADHAAHIVVGTLMPHARVGQPQLPYGVENVVHLNMHCFLGTLSSPDNGNHTPAASHGRYELLWAVYSQGALSHD